MRYSAITRFGLDGIAILERETPRPHEFHVLVRVHANSLNYRDLRVAQGAYDPRMPLPRVPLSDGAGEVVEIGSGVTRWKPGDRVAAIFMQSWLAGAIDDSHARSALGGALDGMAAEYVVLHEDGLVRIPEYLTDGEAATLPCAAVTAWNALMCQSRVAPGETVLVQGTGGVSLFALAFARMAGARVIATSGSEDKLARVKALGASEVINYRQTPDWGKHVKKLTGGRGVDHIVEVGGSGTLGQSLQAARVGGHIHMIGVLTGTSGEIPTVLILHKSIQVHGIYVGSRAMFENMNRALETHAIHPVIDARYPLAELASSLAHLEQATHFGKIVIQQEHS